MNISRRQFLRGFISLAIVPNALGGCAQESSEEMEKQVREASKLPDKDLLMTSFFPMLKMNEKEILCFYRDKKRKVTVGYGTNVEAHPGWLNGVEIYHGGRKLSQEETKTFINGITSKTDSELGTYRITQSDAQKMANIGMGAFIDKLASAFTDSKTGKSFFFELPLCMQALCLDVMYNVGEFGFSKYVKFKAAMTQRDYATAVKESKVYVNSKTKAVNLQRERRKKRLIRVMDIVQKNTGKSMEQLSQLLKADYEAEVPWRIRALRGSDEIACEKSLAIGERVLQKRQLEAQKKTTLTRVNAVQSR